MIRVIALVAIFGLVTGQGGRPRRPVGGQQGGRTTAPVAPISDQCMDCICMGSSDCNLNQKCHAAGSSAYFCGPYVISWAYWHDGGRPGDKGGKSDFETCLNDKFCAEQSVRGYMKKHGKDCDGDGAVTCYDFARIHKLGPLECASESIYNTDYWQKFSVCYDGGSNSAVAPAGANAPADDDYYAFDDQDQAAG